MKLDIKNNLKKLMPSIFKLIDEESFKWESINKSFQKVKENRGKQYVTKKEEFLRELSFLDVINRASLKNIDLLIMTGYFELVFNELEKNLLSEEKKLIKTTIYNLLTNYDKNYLNFLSELSILNYMIKTYGFRLKQIEYTTCTGKKIDFLFERNGNEIIPVEVMNIHIPENKKIRSIYEDIAGFLYQRFAIKIKEKEFSQNNIFYLAPVVWSSNIENLQILSEFYKNNCINIKIVLPLFCHQNFTNNIDDEFKHKFEPISEIFDNLS